MSSLQKITPFLWFDQQAEEAVAFYVSIFPNSRIITTTHYTDAGPGPKGSVMTVAFELEGQAFTALNGGEHTASFDDGTLPAPFRPLVEYARAKAVTAK